MSKALYAVLNPVVGRILRSPLHGLMSANTMLLTFEGRKSGRRYTTPVSYRETGGEVHCFTDVANRWWRNLEGGAEVGLQLRGRARRGRASVLADGSDGVRSALRDMLVAVPRDARFAGVALDGEGRPLEVDLESASQRMVWIRVALTAD